MSGKNTAVFGVYTTAESADDAVDTLRTQGFRSTDISVTVSAERRLESVRP